MPHPRLARLAWVAAVLAAAYLVAAVGATLLTPVTPPTAIYSWYGERVAAAWGGVKSAGGAWAVACDQAEELAATLAPPAGLLLAALLLRAAALGHLALTGPAGGLLRAARRPAAAGMVAAVLAGGLGVARWVNPGAQSPTDTEQYHFAHRLYLAADHGQLYYWLPERLPGRPTRDLDPGWYNRVRVANWTAQVALAVCTEGVALAVGVRSAGVLLLLCATVYCLGRPDPDADP